MLYLKDRTIKEERNQFITALLSKDSQEFAIAQKIIEKKPEEPAKPPEFIPETELSDEDFLKNIKKINGQE